LMLDSTPFPVTDRQAAWLPLAAIGLTTLAGLAGIALTALAFSGNGFEVMTQSNGKPLGASAQDLWLVVACAFPCLMFFALLFWRVVRIMPAMIGFAGVIFPLILPIMSQPPGSSASHDIFQPWIVAWAPWWAVLALFGCVFLAWEAPFQVATARCIGFMESFSTIFNLRNRQLIGPARPTWPTRLADSLMALFVLAFYAVLFLHKGFWTATTGMHGMIVIFVVAMVFGISRGALNLWRLNRASGLGTARALLALAVELTVVGYLFRDYFGVARGLHVRCAHCGGWRMAWSATCPACHDRSPGLQAGAARARQTVPSGLWAVIFPPRLWKVMIPINDIGAFAFRCIWPIQVILMTMMGRR
jgi:hypothetical protein